MDQMPKFKTRRQFFYPISSPVIDDNSNRINRNPKFAFVPPRDIAKPTAANKTIYVSHFEIVEPATSYWRISMWASLTVLLATLGIHFARPYRPH